MSKLHPIAIAGMERHLPIVPITDKIHIAFLKLYGDVELIEGSAQALAEQLHPDIDVILGPESGGILLAHLVSVRTGKPYAVARKKVRPHMINPLRVRVQTIASPELQELILDDADKGRMRGAKVAILDEVISTGATVTALKQLVERAGGTVSQVLAVATEGEDDPSITRLCHLPIFPGPQQP